MQITIQLGKKGITEGFMQEVKKAFSNSDRVRIPILRSYCRDKAKLAEIINSILAVLGNKYTARAVGYTIFLKKWRKERK